MSGKVNVDAVIKGYIHKGVSALEVIEGELFVTLTDGEVKSLGRVIPDGASVFDENSEKIPSMKAVAEYVKATLLPVAYIDSEVVI